MEEKITINELKEISQKFRSKASHVLKASWQDDLSRLEHLIKFIGKTPILDKFIQQQVSRWNFQDELKRKLKSPKSLLNSIISESNDEKEVSFLYQFLEYVLETHNSTDDTFQLLVWKFSRGFHQGLTPDISEDVNQFKDKFLQHFVNHITSYLNTLINNHQQQTEGKATNIYNMSGNFGIGSMSGGEIEDNANVSGMYRPINTKAKGNKFMSENTQQNVTQNIGTNTGQAQAIAAGRDVNANQSMNQGEGAEEITQEEAVELLTEIEKLIKTANLPSEIVEEAADYTSMAKKEAKKKEPRKSLVVGNLEGAISLLQNLSKTTDAAKELIVKLKPHVVKLATWLGVAATNFLG